MLATRGTNVDDVERVPGGKSFFWAGEYGWDLNSRETLDTQLGVFEDFQPAAVGRLARLRRAVPGQHPARAPAERARAVRPVQFVAMDSMNLWIDIARDALVEVIRRVDCVVLNDAEFRQLTDRPSIVARGARGAGDGPVGWSWPSRASTAPR